MPILRLRRAACVAAAAVLAACSDIVPTNPSADAAGPLASTYAGVETALGCCGAFQDVNTAGLMVGAMDDEDHRARAITYTPAAGAHRLRTLDSIYKVDGTSDWAYGVNDLGQVVGRARNRNAVDRPVFWSSAAALPVDMGELRAGGAGEALDVNRHGMAVGRAEVEPYMHHAFIWTQAGGMVDIGPATGISMASAVNDSGKVVGTAEIPGALHRGFVWTQAGGRVPLGTFGGQHSSAADINLKGQVAGTASNAAGRDRAFLWTQAGGMQDLGTLGGRWSIATAINDLGVVVGYSETAAGQTLPFAWSPRTGMRAIGSAWTYAQGVNRSGLVVGDVDGGYPVYWQITETNSRPSLVFHTNFGNVYEGETGLFAHPWTSQNGTQYFQYEWEDSEGDALYSTWSFGDGTSLNVGATKTENTVPKMYRDQGTYPVRLIVTDPSGARDTATASVTILNRAPTGTFYTPFNSTFEGAPFQLVAQRIADGPADLAAGVEASFSCGGAFSAYAKVYTHTCPAVADQTGLTLGLRLRDKDGAVTEYLRAFTIHNAIPAPRVVAVSSTSIAKGGTFVAGGTFTDAGGLDAPWKFRYFWGDGTYTAGTVNARGSIPTMSHVYPTAGSYSVSLWITDKDGRTGQSAPITVNVAP